jgi:AraC-like DNA-binding protein
LCLELVRSGQWTLEAISFVSGVSRRHLTRWCAEEQINPWRLRRLAETRLRDRFEALRHTEPRQDAPAPPAQKKKRI